MQLSSGVKLYLSAVAAGLVIVVKQGTRNA